MATIKYLSIFSIGAVGYAIIELAWRARTHWTMMITGGICFMIIYTLSKISRIPLAYKCAIGAISITVVEFIVGCIVNRSLGWGVWDYSNMEFNIMGQVCLLFSIIWYLICIPALYICKLLDNTLFLSYERKYEEIFRKKEKNISNKGKYL
jgi:uncharacterized membrane protein